MKGIVTGCALVLLIGAAPVWAAAVYKWVDADGKTHYGDRPSTDQAQIAVDASIIPAALQNRLRNLDPHFTITKFGGDTKFGVICGEFNPDVTDAQEPGFPAALDASGLGLIRTRTGYAQDAEREQQRYASRYDNSRCPSTSQDSSNACRAFRRSSSDMRLCMERQRTNRSIDNVQYRTYQIRFNQDIIRLYRVGDDPIR